MELIIVAIYAGILALVAPYVFQANDFVGKLTPLGMGLASGSLLWVIFTWVGLNYADPWIWFIVMLGMPAATWLGVHWLQAKRQKLEDAEIAAVEATVKH